MWVTQAPAPPAPAGAPIKFYAVHDDPETRRSLQDLLTVPPGVGLGKGRDYLHSGHSGEQYDYLRVVNAWRIIDPEKARRFDAFKATVVPAASRVPLRAAYEAAASDVIACGSHSQYAFSHLRALHTLAEPGTVCGPGDGMRGNEVLAAPRMSREE